MPAAPHSFVHLQLFNYQRRTEPMATMQHENEKPKKRPVLLFVALLALAAFMYLSIMYKIINYGP
jgi:hypothetical protein